MAEMKGMKMVNISPEVWAKKHKLLIKTDTCSLCAKTLKLDMPCESYGYVGFIRRGCNYCDSDMVKCYFRPVSSEKREFWSSITKAILS